MSESPLRDGVRLRSPPTSKDIELVSSPTPQHHPPPIKISSVSSRKNSYFMRIFLGILLISAISVAIFLRDAISARLGITGNGTGQREYIPVLSEQVFTMIANRDIRAVNKTLFLESVFDPIVKVPIEAIVGFERSLLTEFNQTKGVFTQIKLKFSSMYYGSNDFRDSVWKFIKSGYLSEFGIIGFGEGYQIPRNICPPGSFGASCQACSPCSGSLVCEHGSMGSGACICPAVFMTDMELFNRIGDYVAGRCIALDQESLDGGKVAVEIGETSKRSVKLKNVGSTTENVAGISVMADNSLSVDLSSYFIATANVEFPIALAPGNTLIVSVEFQPDIPLRISGSLFIFVDNIPDNVADDATMSVPVSVEGTIAGKTPEDGRIKGKFSIFRVDCGSLQDTIYEGVRFESDTWIIDGNTNLVDSSTNLHPLFKSYTRLRYLASGYHYKFPIRFPGDIILNFNFVDFESTEVGKRAFHIFVNDRRITDQPIDIFASTGAIGTVLSVPITLTGDYSQSDISIRFDYQVGVPVISALEIFQQLDISIDDLKKIAEVEINYAEALHKSYLFFQQMKSGRFSSRRLAWRNDSCLECLGPEGQDLTGGYYEAGGNYLKLNFPMAWSITSVAIGLLEHKQGHIKSNELSYGLETLREAYDYFMNCRLDSQRIVMSIGLSKRDFTYFGPPESYSTAIKQRPVWVLTMNPKQRSSETCAEIAAALAVGSMVFRDIDPAYSSKLISESIEFYKFATKYPGGYNENKATNEGFADIAKLYPSRSYLDELSWAAAWIYRANQQQLYLDEARKYYRQYQNANAQACGWAYSWDEKSPFLHILLGLIDPDLTNQDYYDSKAREYFDQYLPGPKQTVPHTPKGMAYIAPWGSVRYAANTGYIALLYSKYLAARNVGTSSYRTDLYTYGKSQIDYILGKTGTSMVVGIGSKGPLLIYHKSAAYSFLCYPQSRTYHIAYGAVSGGPMQINGRPSDFHWNLGRVEGFVKYTEPGLDYSGALTAAISLLAQDSAVTPISDADLDLGWNYQCGDTRIGPGGTLPTT